SYDVYTALQQRADLNWGDNVGLADSFLGRLARFRDLSLRWQGGANDLASLVGKKARQERALRFVREDRYNLFGLAGLIALYDHASDRCFRPGVGMAWKLFEDTPGLSYIARYEQARSLFHGGQAAAARTAFKELYEKSLKEGALPPIQADFRQALGTETWDALIRQTAAKFIQEKRRPAAVALAWQCWQLEDAPLAANLLALALDGTQDDAELLLTHLAAIEFLSQTNQHMQAERLLQPLLKHAKFSRCAYLWRLGAQIAEKRQQTARSMECRERALGIEYRHRPDEINLETVRKEYGKLLDHYESLAKAAAAMKIEPPRDLAARTIRAADRWRAIDRDSEKPCQAAAKILRTLGAEDMPWDYLTTPIGQGPNESSSGLGLAQSLAQEGNLDLADRAFAAASEAEPTNAQILWDRAQNLRQAGKMTEAAKLIRELADGKWDARFQWLQTQARG